MKSTAEQYVILILKNDFKCEGQLVKIDKENLKVILKNAKKFLQATNGSVSEETFHDTLEVSKSDIKEVRMTSVPEDKKQVESKQPEIPGSIPEELTKKALDKLGDKSYNKSNFFDGLQQMNNKDAFYDSKKCNDKNKETFNLPDDYGVSESHSRGSYRGRGRRGGGRYNNHGSGGNRGGYNRRGGRGKQRGRGMHSYNSDKQSYKEIDDGSSLYSKFESMSMNSGFQMGNTGFQGKEIEKSIYES